MKRTRITSSNVISLEEYRQSKRFRRRALRPRDLDAEMIKALETAEPPAEAAAFGDEITPSTPRGRR